ncbi:MAG: hypothetical protein QI223_09665 [Candidatus Korarchaeota archaeon]|nr:hypothetical protein [Candidatus Korarchaeota archaeon]
MPSRPLHAFFASALVIALCLPTLHALGAQGEYNPLVYERLEVTARVSEDGAVTVTVRATLRNDGRVPVVPGYGKLPVSGIRQRSAGGLPLPGQRRVNLSVTVLSARDLTRNVDMEVVPLWENGSLVLRYSLWQPLRPGQRESFEFSFRIENGVARGVLFDEFAFGIGPISNRVERGRVVIFPPAGSRVTYASPGPGSRGESVEWDLSGLPEGGRVRVWVEFSPLPLPMLPIKGYLVFWGALIVVMLVLIASRALRRSEGRRPRLAPRARPP